MFCIMHSSVLRIEIAYVTAIGVYYLCKFRYRTAMYSDVLSEIRIVNATISIRYIIIS